MGLEERGDGHEYEHAETYEKGDEHKYLGEGYEEIEELISHPAPLLPRVLPLALLPVGELRLCVFRPGIFRLPAGLRPWWQNLSRYDH